MKIDSVRRAFGLLAGMLAITSVCFAQPLNGAEKPARSAAQRVLDQSAADSKFTFVVFHKVDSPETRAMIKVAKEGAAKRSDKAAVAVVQVGDPAEQAVVEMFDVARSPMPLMIAVAPNLAMTGLFPKTLKDEQLDACIVTPTMVRVMKSLQDGKLVFVCVQATEKTSIPPVVAAMRLDPDFSSRIVVESMQLRDPHETRFLQQMQIDPQQTRTTLAALLAPPGLLIGKYDAAATKDQVSTALHHAGKCCDDPNCKHNHGPSTQRPDASRRK